MKMPFVLLFISAGVGIAIALGNFGCKTKTLPRTVSLQQPKQNPSKSRDGAVAIKPWKYQTLESVTGDKGNIQPLIPVMMWNKKISAQSLMGMDTGSTGTTIRRNLFNKLGLKVIRSDVYAQSRRVSVAQLTWLKIGTLWVSGVEAAVIEDNVMKHDLGSVDGIIGTDILDHTKILLNVPKQQVYVTSRSIPIDGMTAVDLIPLKEGGYGIKASVNGQKRLMLIDTGSYHTTIVKDVNSKGIAMKGAPCYNDTGVYGDIKTCDGAADIEIGGVKYPHFLIGVSERHLFQKDEEAGGIGMDILSRQRIVLDFPNRKMYIATQ